MRKLTLALVLCGALALTSTPASARGVIVYSNGEKFEVTQKIPADLILEEWIDEHVNVGVKFNQFSIFWIPMWNYGEKENVLINDAEDTYYDLSVEEIAYLNEEYGLDISEKPRIGFWNSIGGKLIWTAVLLFFVWGGVNRKKKEEEDDAVWQDESAPEESPADNA